jgi:hypothetical protein
MSNMQSIYKRNSQSYYVLNNEEYKYMWINDIYIYTSEN